MLQRQDEGVGRDSQTSGGTLCKPVAATSPVVPMDLTPGVRMSGPLLWPALTGECPIRGVGRNHKCSCRAASRVPTKFRGSVHGLVDRWQVIYPAGNRSALDVGTRLTRTPYTTGDIGLLAPSVRLASRTLATERR